MTSLRHQHSLEAAQCSQIEFCLAGGLVRYRLDAVHHRLPIYYLQELIRRADDDMIFAIRTLQKGYALHGILYTLRPE
ncbi:hypothetical protein NECAME_03376 [Necator americanus]|uniref:Uncharacterized protein n=1 Tax=Necator americanus TaxID=51031 RepID=W2T6S8_NECAM|nr:hypothetical protein NECAME_03376 [Necator americanus]ETN76707.1 hypothetical protein NECAME_03376 [Necator americanus]